MLPTIFVGVKVVTTALGPSLAGSDKVQVSSKGSTVKNSFGIVTAGKYDISSAMTDISSIKPGSTGILSNFAYEISKHRCYERETEGLTQLVAY